MLNSLEMLAGASVIASDGDIGRVSHFLFDDRSWSIRYVVVDVRSWLTRRDVIISVDTVEKPDWTKKTIQIRLTKDQVRNSPDMDSRKPVSRQQEIAMREYYHWPAAWLDINDINFEIPSAAPPSGHQYPAKDGEDPHLRSSEAVTGYQVWAEDRVMGRVENFIADEDSWHVGYLDVKAGDWLHSRSVLIPTRWVKNISWADHRVNLIHSRDGL
jgi:uncharacterized protein YrrD